MPKVGEVLGFIYSQHGAASYQKLGSTTQVGVQAAQLAGQPVLHMRLARALGERSRLRLDRSTDPHACTSSGRNGVRF